MRKAKLFVVAASVLGFSAGAWAHVPEGQVFAAWQWPTSQLPNLDGDISEWNVIPEEYWIDIFQTSVAEGDIGREIDTANLNFRIVMAWNDELDRIYRAYDRFDDVWDRDGGGFGCCGQDDSIEISIDADHSGDFFWAFEGTDEELKRNRGRHAQTGHFRWPALAPFGWNWFWMSTSDWHDKEPYSCCPTSFTLNGTQGSEATLQAEWYTVAWDDFNYQGPEVSIRHDFVEGEIFGAGLQVIDNDNGPSEDDPRTAKWALGGQSDIFGNASSISDFILLPVDTERLPTAVENDTWGHIKASFAQ
ncbi:MAG: hypothetical protein HYW07_21895 [Candidatus Latescibacteria bacterium]|nr:hypothetical protein [Candidatus Latescibacterota bacterium]